MYYTKIDTRQILLSYWFLTIFIILNNIQIIHIILFFYMFPINYIYYDPKYYYERILLTMRTISTSESNFWLVGKLIHPNLNMFIVWKTY